MRSTLTSNNSDAKNDKVDYYKSAFCNYLTDIYFVINNKMKFLISEMTALKYFMPIVIEGNKNGIHSTLIVFPSGKYNCPFKKEHANQLRLFSEIHNFTLCEAGKENKNKEVVFLIEGGPKYKTINKSKSISLCYSTDFTVGYENYINEVDHVIFSSKYISNYYNKHNKKNLYLGSPKFDYELSDEEVLKKYSLDPLKKKAIIFYPRIRDIKLCQLEKISYYLRELDYQIVIKSRGKDPIQQNHNSLADKCLYDVSWFPHTSLELLKISNLVINFSSTVIEETIAFKKPMINFHIKPFRKPLDFLYDYSFVKNLDKNFEKLEFEKTVTNFENNTYDYEIANNLLFDTKNSSKDIINFVMNI